MYVINSLANSCSCCWHVGCP